MNYHTATRPTPRLGSVPAKVPPHGLTFAQVAALERKRCAERDGALNGHSSRAYRKGTAKGSAERQKRIQEFEALLDADPGQSIQTYAERIGLRPETLRTYLPTIGQRREVITEKRGTLRHYSLGKEQGE